MKQMLLVMMFSLLCSGFLFAQSPASAASPAKAEELAAQDGTITRYKGWEVRFGIAGCAGAAGGAGTASAAGVVGAAQADLSRLVGKAESFAVDLFRLKDGASGESRVLGVGEAHGLFPVTPEGAAAVVLDYPNLRAISPRAREVRVLESSASRWYVYEDLGIDFMGISIGYRIEAETFRDELPDGAIGVRCRLAKSLDGKLYAADTSWYFRRILVGGVPYTYMRIWSTSGLRNPGMGVAGIMKLFTAGELRDQVDAVGKLAAAKR